MHNDVQPQLSNYSDISETNHSIITSRNDILRFLYLGPSAIHMFDITAF